MRFDMSDEDIEEKMKGHGLFHALTNDSDMADFVDRVLTNNGAMVSTTEKMRAGIPVGGASPGIDMDTGGASYFFTRIMRVPTKRSKKIRKHSGFYFKKRLLRRQDAVSYSHDAYGKVTPEYIEKYRQSSVSYWKRFARDEDGGNETLFKNSVTLLDNIDVIVAKDTEERRAILRALRKHGVTELADGRRITDIVMVK